jgi:Protein of unknown function (DUF3046)
LGQMASAAFNRSDPTRLTDRPEPACAVSCRGVAQATDCAVMAYRGGPGRRPTLGRVVAVRLTEFRGLMQAQFGPLRAPSVARDHVFSALEGRTADEALAAGTDPKAVWMAVCDDFDVSEKLRYGLPD